MLFIGLLVLILLIPVMLIRGLIVERSAVLDDAQRDVMQSWGYEQRIAAPILMVPFTEAVAALGNGQVEQRRELYLLPEDLDIDVAVTPDTRYRGIFKVTVYSAAASLRGRFRQPARARFPANTREIHWQEARVAVSVSDARALTVSPRISFGARDSAFEPGGPQIAGLPATIVAPVGDGFADGVAEFSLDLELNGTRRLSLLPLGDTTRVAMRSPWPSPSFVGNYLPQRRDVSADGFSAHWQLSSIGRGLPSAWPAGTVPADLAVQGEFGVELFVPIGVYQLALRATRYAILFVGLNFVGYFLFETLARLRLHPLNYLLVGSANVLFYLLLLSLAEHVPFALAYAASAVAAIVLIAGYSMTVLGERRRAAMMASALTAIYGVLYLTLNAERFAMLAGSLGLWLVLAAVMYLTRHVDWYGGADDGCDASGSAPT